MSDLDGTTFCITGANTGIGRDTAAALAARGGRIILVNRSRERSEGVIADIKAAGGDPAFVACELGDLESVRAAAAEILALDEPINALINNAGLAGQRGLTAQGFELAFGVNHLGHFLLTDLLLDRVRESGAGGLPGGGPARVVIVSSDSHFSAEGIDFEKVRQPTKSITGLPEYGVSKLANVLHAQELARREDPAKLVTSSVHPGVIATDIYRRVPWPIRPILTRFMKSTEEGAQTTLYCATGPALAAETGQYYADCDRKEPSEHATPELAAELWRRSEEWVA